MRSSRTWPSSTARASGRCSCAAPTSTPEKSSRCWCPAGTPSPVGVPVVRGTGEGAAGGAMPGRLAPRARARHRPRPGHRGAAVVDPDPRRRPGAPRPGRQRRAGHGRPGRARHRTGRRNHRCGDARQRAPGPAGAAAPLHQAASGCPGPAPPQGHEPDGREDLHRAGRQDVPAVDVPHPDLPQLRAGPRRRHPGRPRLLRLRPGGAGCAALRGAVRPVHPEPAPVPRL